MTMAVTEGRVILLPQRPAPRASRRARAATPSHAASTSSAGTTRFDLRAAWDAHGGELLGFATNALGERQAAEDCVQETFVRAWKAQDRFAEQRGSVRTWLFAIARNVAIDQMRARARRPTPVDDQGVARMMPAQEPGQDHVDDRILVAEALAVLSPEHREVLVAVKLEGLSYAELSERSGVPTATLRTRSYHALRALRAHLGEEDPHAHDV